MAHLMRTWYITDVDSAEPEYVGVFSSTIPDTFLADGAQVVSVDWSERGQVEVTYLLPGDRRVSHPPEKETP